MFVVFADQTSTTNICTHEFINACCRKAAIPRKLNRYSIVAVIDCF